MPRKRTPVVPAHRETRDRRAFLRWMGSRTLEGVGQELGKSKQRMSEWLRHETEIDDLEVDTWVEVTGIGRRTFLEGRYESRNLAAAEGKPAAVGAR